MSLETRTIAGTIENSPTLVFLHEGLGSVEMWRDFPERVAKATGLGALVYSRRGYGASEPAVLPRSVRFMHDEAYDVLPEVLDAAAISKAILVGHSDGGSIALLHAARFGPPRIQAVIAMAPHVFVEEVALTNIQKAAVAYEQGDLRAKLARYHADVDGAFLGWNRIWLAPEFRTWNIEDELPKITAPMLLIQGKNDEYGTLAQLESIVRHARAPVETCILDACGHSPHRDQAERVIEAMSSFIRRLRST
ncbi:MAG: alpha/beta hydrolase [Polyangiaceae bacterium]